MKDPRLWISNRNGNVFTVTASERYIRQLSRSYQGGVRVKRLAASDWCAWAIGHDHRVYTYVLPSDVPIRVPQTTYENQRWSPFSGFRSANLLPTDRRAWSDEHGDVYLPKESIRLTSAHWDWEGDWFIDENLQGDICTDTGGWQYAVNFTARWTAESSWKSCVRKRKWIRFARYTAATTWALVSDMEVVDTGQCFIDLAVGGQMLPGQPADSISVWAITNNGQVYVRTGVSRDCPEGEDWQHVPCSDMGIINIACGPTGLVWAITWDGHAFVRTHVSRDAVYGLGWESVPYPEEATRLMQVSVGRNSVWALSRDGKVWFRQGVNGDKLYWDATAATGNAWVLMVGDMIHISVSANDQVFALGQEDEDKEIWLRTGVTPAELGGKTWQRVVLEEDPQVFDLNSPLCLMSRASQPSLQSSDDAYSMSGAFDDSTAADGVGSDMGHSHSVPMMSLTSGSVVQPDEMSGGDVVSSDMGQSHSVPMMSLTSGSVVLPDEMSSGDVVSSNMGQSHSVPMMSLTAGSILPDDMSASSGDVVSSDTGQSHLVPMMLLTAGSVLSDKTSVPMMSLTAGSVLSEETSASSSDVISSDMEQNHSVPMMSLTAGSVLPDETPASSSDAVSSDRDHSHSVPMMSMAASSVLPDISSAGPTTASSSIPEKTVNQLIQSSELEAFSGKKAGSFPGSHVISLDKARGRSVSWQVIENENSTHRTSRVPENQKTLEAEEAVEGTTERTSLVKPASVNKGDGDLIKTSNEDVIGEKTVKIRDSSSEPARIILLEGRTISNGADYTENSPFDSSSAQNQEIKPLLSEGEIDSTILSSSYGSDTFESLESNPASDVICNFATDLIDDDVKEQIHDETEKEKPQKIKSDSKGDNSDNGIVTFQDMHDQSDPPSGKSLPRPGSIPWLSIGASESFSGRTSFTSGRASYNSTPSWEHEATPAMTLTMAQPRYAWGWLASGDFVIENSASVPCLSASKSSESSANYIQPKVSKATRENVLQLLRERNKTEINGFASYEHAIERTTWVKRATMKVQWAGSWYDCTLEMEHGVGSQMDGTLTVQFKFKRKHKVVQMSLQEVRCVKMVDDHHLAIYTADRDTSVRPLTLQTLSEAELTEWIGLLNVANLSQWQLNHLIAPGSVCSLTVPGQIFVHCPDETRSKPEEMMWGQHGGHMAVIETTPCGVIWAISFDHTLWVYNQGYGNSVTRELSEMASNLREQVDYRTISVLENQKWFPVVGYCSRGVFHNNFAWTTPKGKFVNSREDIKLPSSQWQWVSDWTVDFATAGGVSNDGWQYSSNFSRPYHPHQGMRDSVRRRQWSRKCKLVTQGPWVSAGPPELVDMSMQVDAPSSPSQPLVIWAIGANGDVLCRSEVTQSQPMGKSWIHVATKLELPFRSVSVGGGYRVWAVAQDGSVWYRTGVSPHTPAGSVWIQVIPPPPGGALLRYISVGGTAVWALDTGGNLWRREEITPTFPEGTRWTYVCNHIRKLSVGPRDQVWVVTEANFGQHKHLAGAVYRRLRITESTPSGTEWELVIGPGWHNTSVRGLMTLNI